MSKNHTNWFPALFTTSNSSIGEGVRQCLKKQQWCMPWRCREQDPSFPLSWSPTNSPASKHTKIQVTAVVASHHKVSKLLTYLELCQSSYTESHKFPHSEPCGFPNVGFHWFVQGLKRCIAFRSKPGSMVQGFHPLGHPLLHQQGILRFALLRDLQSFQHRLLAILQALWLLCIVGAIGF